MISPSPPDAQRRYQPPPEPSLLSRIPWGTLLASLVFFGLAAWLWYRFEWSYRLPQEHTLTDKQGQAMAVRLEARNNDVLKYTMLADNSTRYVTIASLSDKDQEFVQHLSMGLSFVLPMECLMAVDEAKPSMIRVEGHNADWARYTVLSDRTTHYAPLAAFSASDQVVLGQLPSHLNVEIPIERVLTGQGGKALPGHADGRSTDLVRLSARDGTILYYPVRELSAQDQKLIRLLPVDLYLHFPFECTLTDKNNKALNVRLEGRSANTIKYTLLSDGLSYYVPAADFSDLDQEVFRSLPSNLDFVLPFEYTLTDTKGQSLRVRLEARNSNVVKFTLLETGRQYYWSMSAFSPESQKFLRLLPTELRLEFPIEYTLTSQAGQTLQASILGRNADAVKFQLVDGKMYTVPLATLSPESQAFLQLLPANMIDASTPSAAPPPLQASQSLSQLSDFRSTLSSLVAKERTFKNALDSYHPAVTEEKNYGGNIVSRTNVRDPTKESLQAKLDSNRDQIEIACKQINALLDPVPLQGKAKQVQALWSKTMNLIKRSDQIRLDMSKANPSERDVMRVEMRQNQADMVAALNEVNVYLGTYVP